MIPYLLAIATFVMFSYIFVAVDKSIVTSDLFSEEKIREYQYKEISFFKSRFLNIVINFVYHALYLLASPIRHMLSANPTAAFLLTIRVLFMVILHIVVLAFVFLFTSASIRDIIIESNKKAIADINLKIQESNKNLLEEDSILINLSNDRKETAENRDGEAKGTLNKSGPGKNYRFYDSKIQGIDLKIQKRTNDINLIKLREIKLDNKIDYANPSKDLHVAESAAKFNIKIYKDNIENRGTFLFQSIKNNPFEFFALIFPTIGMSLLLIAPLFILVLMKIFQNKSIRLYYDPELQAHFNYYQLGIYNWLLSDETKKPNGKVILDPLVFSDIYYGVIKKHSKSLAKSFILVSQKESDSILIQTIDLNQIVVCSQSKIDELNKNVSDLEKKKKAKQRIISNSEDLNFIDSAILDIKKIESEIDEIHNNIKIENININSNKQKITALESRKKKIDDNQSLWQSTGKSNEEAKFVIANSLAPIISFFSKEFLDRVEIKAP